MSTNIIDCIIDCSKQIIAIIYTLYTIIYTLVVYSDTIRKQVKQYIL